VASWRDSVTEQGQAELDGLLQAAVPFAQQMLAEHGEFFPYGAAVSIDGDVRMVAADPGTGEHPDPTEVLDLLYRQLSGARDGLAASAVVSDVRLLDPPSNAIRVELEHREGVAIAVLLRYDLLPEDGGTSQVVLSDVRAVAGEHRTWPVP
jgi:hypothetical protein